MREKLDVGVIGAMMMCAKDKRIEELEKARDRYKAALVEVFRLCSLERAPDVDDLVINDCIESVTEKALHHENISSQEESS